MHYDFVDIGTSDFDTSIDKLDQSNLLNILLVEPLTHYLEALPNYPNVIKDNVGISNKHSNVKIFYLPEEVIRLHQLSWWLRGCSSIETKHPAVVTELNRKNLSLDLIKVKNIDVITFDMLCKKHSIDSIGYLKIDTEGHEQYILPDVFEKVKNGFVINNIKFENQEYLGNKKFLDYLRDQFIQIGYELVAQTDADIIIKKV